jgi:hypothetical protein
MQSKNIPVKVKDKPNALWDSVLTSLWKDDIETEDGTQEQKRDWDIYSKIAFRRFWDERNSVDRCSR